MEIIYLLIGCSVAVAALFLVSFLWAVKSGQYDDVETPALRILFDESTFKLKNSSSLNPESQDTLVNKQFSKEE